MSYKAKIFATVIFKTYKARLVTLFDMFAEFITSSDMFDAIVVLAGDLFDSFKRHTPTQLVADSKKLFDVVSKGSRTPENKAMLDFSVVREAFREGLISDVLFVGSDWNVADYFTKIMSQAVIRQIFSPVKIHVQPKQWIIRRYG